MKLSRHAGEVVPFRQRRRPPSRPQPPSRPPPSEESLREMRGTVQRLHVLVQNAAVHEYGGEWLEDWAMALESLAATLVSQVQALRR